MINRIWQGKVSASQSPGCRRVLYPAATPLTVQPCRKRTTGTQTTAQSNPSPTVELAWGEAPVSQQSLKKGLLASSPMSKSSHTPDDYTRSRSSTAQCNPQCGNQGQESILRSYETVGLLYTFLLQNSGSGASMGSRVTCCLQC